MFLRQIPLQLEDILINESDNLYDDNNIFLNIPNDSGDFYNISDDDDDQDTNGEFNEKMYDGSLAAYRDFANIVKHSKFNPKDVLLSLATIKKY
ncbi:hypothetical protein GLOIN_2v1765069 [Rhizophagus irregularis DAOM 181602=DAOM 197198]|uniref:Uncharacterized protein n=1 Tax=Rhizophagus irregularis (strain DAOM 181602 / DAOM 197198 / MUCL 43194) TaxID=747089 RepID=A0A2P4QQ37_RHIID|nr:hypothetical protein GLOIN_2v1765069 [Rhizophagus irregularis DAOM 181602=DAOM 197198]POG79746.1 hypothetical protein GLOIN_2v1765069 [Rhizophagus irregularis DAOM 181602=DAOM 197198]|eukprot:XP_025186612.1 hypothetical protein GLOIN_2v1765069 [Rhizophagus irregularis DAOM 181602=DAOM 197198]